VGRTVKHKDPPLFTGPLIGFLTLHPSHGEESSEGSGRLGGEAGGFLRPPLSHPSRLKGPPCITRKRKWEANENTGGVGVDTYLPSPPPYFLCGCKVSLNGDRVFNALTCTIPRNAHKHRRLGTRCWLHRRVESRKITARWCHAPPLLPPASPSDPITAGRKYDMTNGSGLAVH